ncbi:MAG: single-stranded-DNA-specific exonuclease RecJ [Candidatus Omnitrophica bacterium]|nr:single-stranded-DNA-specific exonuclease RecJ [Candidatus Omnitrophota bacterium]
MNKLWIIKSQNAAHKEMLSKELNISSVLAGLLMNRNLTTPQEIDEFLKCKKSALHNPFGLKDMKKAVERVKKAVRDKEKIMVYGDYDADGITAVALLTTFLKKEGAAVEWYLPNRLQEGYGLNPGAAKYIKSKGISLLITVDCGMTDKEEIGFLKACGIDTIVVDHHRPQKEDLPDAFCCINPLQPDCAYPFKELAGVGLAYKLVCALSGDVEHKNEEFLDLVALGTVADVSAQTGENRILTRLGLLRFAKTKRVGLRALMEAAGLSAAQIQTEHIGFIIGPRINVSGRIGSPDIALRLILTEDPAEAKELAHVLNEENSFRQRLQEGIFKEAVSAVEGQFNFKEQKVIVVWGADWHPGVIGVVASKIADRFYRPAIILNVQGDIAKGSGRSVENFHLFDAVYKCRDLLESFGGHEAACGVTMRRENMEIFRDSINKAAHAMAGTDNLIPKIDVDMELPLSLLDEGLLAELDMLGPFGAGNPQPLFLSKDVKIKKDTARQFGRNGLRMWVTGKGVMCEAVCFNAFDMFGRGTEDLDRVDLVYYPKLRSRSGIGTLKLEVEDFKPV